MKEIRIKYTDPDMPKLECIDKGDWIDLRTAEDVDMKSGEFKLINLGVVMQLPEGYEAIMAPRSSTFKKHGIIETNSIGVIDFSFRGESDYWRFPALAMRNTFIPKYTRIAQFRIVKNQPKINFVESDGSDFGEDRGGIGSTGEM